MHLRTAGSLRQRSGSPSHAPGVGDYHTQHVLGTGRSAEQQREIAPAGAAVRVKAHKASPRATQDGQFAGIATAAVNQRVIGLIVQVGVVCE